MSQFIAFKCFTRLGHTAWDCKPTQVGATTRLFEIKNAGVVVLVETFGGNRAYYFYVSRDLDLLAEESNIKAQYPQRELSWEHQEDATWSFIKRYAREFNFT